MLQAGEVEMQDYAMGQLEKKCNLATERLLRNASKQMSALVHKITNIRACESAAVGIGLSVRESSEDIAKDNDLDGHIVCNVAFAAVKKLPQSLEP